MTLPGVSVLDAAFALSVTAAGMIHPALCLAVAAGYFALSAYIADRRSTPEAKP
jgi:NAD/NADP transhydrogenase alpha subunit